MGLWAWIGSNFRVHDFSNDGEAVIDPPSSGFSESSAINVQGGFWLLLFFIPPITAIATPQVISEMLILSSEGILHEFSCKRPLRHQFELSFLEFIQVCRTTIARTAISGKEKQKLGHRL